MQEKETIKTLKENVTVNPQDLEQSNSSLEMTPKVKATKEKN